MPIDVIPHRPILGSRAFTWSSEADCEAFARRLAAAPDLRQAFVELHGPLGAGKTTFARHLLRALGAQGRIKSPTYALMEPYDLPGGPVSHFDFYRFGDPHEWEEAGLRDVFAAPGLKLAEWPEKAAAVLPAADLAVFIEPQGDELRRVEVQAGTPLGLGLLEALA